MIYSDFIPTSAEGQNFFALFFFFLLPIFTQVNRHRLSETNSASRLFYQYIFYFGGAESEGVEVGTSCQNLYEVCRI